MIETYEEFETALDEAVRILDHPPGEDSPAHDRLLVLMKEIAAYRPAVRRDAPKAASESELLSGRLDAFQARLSPPYSTHWRAMVGGDLRAVG